MRSLQDSVVWPYLSEPDKDVVEVWEEEIARLEARLFVLKAQRRQIHDQASARRHRRESSPFTRP